MGPDFVIATVDNPQPHVVQFEDLYAQREQIAHITLLWNFNSYHVNVAERHFIVNGGRMIIRGEDQFSGTAQLIYTRRKRVDMLMEDDSIPAHRTLYLVGLKDGDRELMLEIAEDGSRYTWRTKR